MLDKDDSISMIEKTSVDWTDIYTTPIKGLTI